MLRPLVLHPRSGLELPNKDPGLLHFWFSTTELSAFLGTEGLRVGVLEPVYPFHVCGLFPASAFASIPSSLQCSGLGA